MKLAMYSNFLSIHQLPFCREMFRTLGESFTFVATEPIAAERLQLGYPDLDREYPFVLRTYEGEAQQKKAMQLALDADVVIIGSAPWLYIEERLHQNKLTFLYSERIYKSGYQCWKWPVRMWRFHKKYGKHKSLYLLCASAYTAADFAKTRNFLKKAYKWGYFPEAHSYENLDSHMTGKKPNTLLWAGRFLDWKHPEQVVEVARRLKAENYDFQVQMLGNGAFQESIAQLVRQHGLQEQVQLVGAVPSAKVRDYMDVASVFLFTSDRKEGWGAVLNESMNSACAVVASDAIGAVPFLLKNGENGLSYRSCDVDDLYEKVKYLLDHEQQRKEMGKKAYETITTLWNAETAAQRLLNLSEAFLQGERNPDLYENGPCSKAEIIK